MSFPKQVAKALQKIYVSGTFESITGMHSDWKPSGVTFDHIKASVRVDPIPSDPDLPYDEWTWSDDLRTEDDRANREEARDIADLVDGIAKKHGMRAELFVWDYTGGDRDIFDANFHVIMRLRVPRESWRNR